MFTTRMIRTVSFAALCVMVIAYAGCSKDQEAAKPSPSASDTTAPAMGIDGDKAAPMAMLAKADLVDGKADHIVSKCAGCDFAMDGDAKHMVKRGAYKLHFCSESCKGTFTKDIRQSILALNIPED